MKKVMFTIIVILTALAVVFVAPAIFAFSATALFGWPFWPGFWLAFATGIIIRGSKDPATI